MVNQDEIHRMAHSEDAFERQGASHEFYFNYVELLDKGQAENDLYKLIDDDINQVRWSATEALGVVFPHIHDKLRAWNKLHKLTSDAEYVVRNFAAYVVGKVYAHIPNKNQAYYDLIRLTKDENNSVISTAYYSLGRISILKATNAENKENFKKHLEEAIQYFEKSSEKMNCSDPSKFCLPFYRSFHAITSGKKDSEAKVDKYIAEAKSLVGGSKSREKLLVAVEILSKALKEAHETDKIDFNVMKSDLNAFRRYCDRACELLDSTWETAPDAVNLMRRGLPIIDENIKKILADIEEKSKDFCKDSKQTPFENISRIAYQQIEGVKNVDSVIEAETKLNALSPILRSISNIILPEESNKVLLDQLDEMEVAELCDKAKIIQSALISFHPQIINLKKTNTEKDIWIEYLKDGITQRLDNINFGVFKIKHRSAEMSLALNQVQTELKKINKIKNDLDNIGINLEELGESQNQNFQELNDGMKNICNIIENELLPKLPENDDKQTIIDKIDELKQSETETLFNRVAGFSSIIGLILPLLL